MATIMAIQGVLAGLNVCMKGIYMVNAGSLRVHALDDPNPLCFACAFWAIQIAFFT
jgi:hypothetical protein